MNFFRGVINALLIELAAGRLLDGREWNEMPEAQP